MEDAPYSWPERPPKELLPYPGSAVLYKAAFPLERSMADAGCERLLELEAEEVTYAWDPWLIAPWNLPYLAWAMGVTLWEPGWQDATKREWTARQWEFKGKRGTEGGIEMAVNFVGRDHAQTADQYDLVQMVTPPQGFFASEDMTKEEWDEWIHLMPELRIKLVEGRGVALPDEWFAGDPTEEPAGCPAPPASCGPGSGDGAFADQAFISPDDGWILHGRRVILRQWGVETPLQVVETTTTEWEGEVLDIERVHVPGKAPLAFFADDGFADEEKFPTAEDEVEPKIITLNLNHAYNHSESTYGLSMVWPGLAPMDPRFERVSDIGEAGPFTFADDVFVGRPSTPYWPPPQPPGPNLEPDPEDNFAGEDQGGDMLADRIFMLDPMITAPMTAGMSFADVDRTDMPAYHAEAVIDLHTEEDAPSWFAEDGTMIEAYAIDEDLSHVDRACRAVVAAKALRDKIGCAFTPLRPIAPQDIVTEETRVGDMAPFRL